MVGIYISNLFQHVQPDFYAQLYLGSFIDLEVRWQGLDKGVLTKDDSTLVECLSLCITSTGQVRFIERGCRTSTYISTTPIK